MRINQSEIVSEQYKTSNNLNTRISIHEKYSKNKLGFGNWIFSHYHMNPNIEILELGCGTGDMWRTHIQSLDVSTNIILTDFSEGMLSAAKNLLGEHPNISYSIVNIENIPYINGRFEMVIANMMLYHVPNLHKGLSEVRRVLSSDGVFYCATYGENGIIPFIANLLKPFGVNDKTNKNFTLQNGFDILKNYFSNVQRYDYEDSLEVTNIDDIIDYIYSLTNMVEMKNIKREILRSVLMQQMKDGVLYIPKEYGMFVCKK